MWVLDDLCSGCNFSPCCYYNGCICDSRVYELTSYLLPTRTCHHANVGVKGGEWVGCHGGCGP